MTSGMSVPRAKEVQVAIYVNVEAHTRSRPAAVLCAWGLGSCRGKAQRTVVDEGASRFHTRLMENDHNTDSPPWIPSTIPAIVRERIERAADRPVACESVKDQ